MSFWKNLFSSDKNKNLEPPYDVSVQDTFNNSSTQNEIKDHISAAEVPNNQSTSRDEKQENSTQQNEANTSAQNPITEKASKAYDLF
jgi:hypothetical protein